MATTSKKSKRNGTSAQVLTKGEYREMPVVVVTFASGITLEMMWGWLGYYVEAMIGVYSPIEHHVKPYKLSREAKKIIVAAMHEKSERQLCETRMRQIAKIARQSFALNDFLVALAEDAGLPKPSARAQKR